MSQELRIVTELRTKPVEYYCEAENPLELELAKEPGVEEQLKNVAEGSLLFEDRDAKQGIPGLPVPSAEETTPILQAAAYLGVNNITVGIYTKCGTVLDTTTTEIVRMLADHPEITPSVAIPAMPAAAEWAKNLYANVNPNLEIYTFMPVGKDRRKTHGWTMETVVAKTEETIKHITDYMPAQVIAVVEQASQCEEAELFSMVDMAARANAAGICIADSLSMFDEEAAFRCVYRMKNYIRYQVRTAEEAGDFERAGQYLRLRIEYHGHNDYGDASLAARGAVRAGARAHVTPGDPAGIGERAGNASINDTIRNLNHFLISHGRRPRRPPFISTVQYDAMTDDEVVALTEMVGEMVDRGFIKSTGVDPKKYGPGNENAYVTCAALHADYVRKIWRQLKRYRTQLAMLEDHFGAQGVDMRSPRAAQVLSVYRRKVRDAVRLHMTGYLPNRPGQSLEHMKHKFGINAYSNEDTAALYIHELSDGMIEPDEVSPELVQRILHAAKIDNKPLSREEVCELIGQYHGYRKAANQ